MTTKTKATRRSSRYDAPKPVLAQSTVTDQIITQDFERGSMIAAVITSIFIGIAMLMWAVCAV